MKKIRSLALATSMLIVGSSCMGLAACGAKPATKTDKSKTQLIVKYYNGGFGQVWLDKLIEKFEETYAEKSFEEGKKGVQFTKDFEKKNIIASQIRDYSADVFLLEHVSYDEAIKKNALLDITDVVTGVAPKLDGTDETATIESKMNADSKSYYGRQVDGETNYYAIPTFSAWHDMIYNIELFETDGYFFNSASDAMLAEFDEKYKANSVDLMDIMYLSNYFTGDRTDLSKGPDGEPNTDDDGLPATYAEFKMFLEYVSQSSGNSVIPMIWNGNAHHYFATWANDIWANYEGVENMMMHLNLSSGGKQVDNLITIKNGQETAVAPIEITPGNAYLLQQQKGKLEALRFLEMILSDGNYYEPLSFSEGLQHTDAQNYFINNNVINDKKYAILMDGNWWNTEAKLWFRNDTFSSARFGIMPTPKVDSTHIGESQTKVDGYISNMFIKSTISKSKISAAKTFISYLNSDEAMSIFSEFTQGVRNMNYTVDEATLSRMTEYGRQAYRTYQSGKFDVISWVPRSPEAQVNTSYLNQLTYGWSGKSYTDNPGDVLFDNPSLSAESYFQNIADKWNATQWAITYKKA